MKPWGQVVNVAGAALKTINANLSRRGSGMAEIDGEYVPPDPLIPYKDTETSVEFQNAARYGKGLREQLAVQPFPDRTKDKLHMFPTMQALEKWLSWSRSRCKRISPIFRSSCWILVQSDEGSIRLPDVAGH